MTAMGAAGPGMAGTEHRAPRILSNEHRGKCGRRRCALALGTAAVSGGTGLPLVTGSSAPEAPPPAPEAPPSSQRAPPSAPEVLPSTPEAPPLGLTFHPGNWTLAWRCSLDVAVMRCSATDTQRGRPRRQAVKPRGCHCRFRPLTLHLGVALEVDAVAGNFSAHERLDYIVPGPPGSEAVNVSCEIHDAAAMTCAWGSGPKAPPDAHYFLVLRDATTGRKLPGCPGGPSGCRLDDLAGLPRLLHVTVAGSSQSGALRAYDVILNTKAIERLSPPRDVTGRCNASHCAVTWAPPRTWADMGFADFRYELDLRRVDADPDATVAFSSRPENRFEFPSPEPRVGHAVRARAGDVRSERWSAWSPRVEFGAARPAVPRLRIYVTTAAATLVCALGLALAWRRFAGRRIPEIRDKVSDDAHINPETLRKDLQEVPFPSTRK